MCKEATSKRLCVAALTMVSLTGWAAPTFAQNEPAATPAEAPVEQPAPAATGPAEAEPMPAPPTPAPMAPLPPPPPQVQGSQPYGAQPYGNGYQSGWPNGITRPFSFSLVAGPGFLSGTDETNRETEYGAIYAFRFGIGFAPNLSLTVGWEGVSVRGRDKITNEKARFGQDAFLVGIQYFMTPRFHFRAGFGTATATEDTDNFSTTDTGGMAAGAGIGFDIVSQSNFALALELSATAAQYPEYTFSMGGAALSLSFF